MDDTIKIEHQPRERSVPCHVKKRGVVTPCAHKGCDRAWRTSDGYCISHGRHFRQWGKTYDFTALGRFWRKVEKTDSCWLWTGHLGEQGYGQIRADDGQRMGAHRFAYVTLVGPVPDGLDLDHVCHTRDLSCPGGVTCQHRRCVNPAHLEPVTRLENTRRSRSYCPDVCQRGHPMADAPVSWSHTRQRFQRSCRKCRSLARSQRNQRARQGVAA